MHWIVLYSHVSYLTEFGDPSCSFRKEVSEDSVLASNFLQFLFLAHTLVPFLGDDFEDLLEDLEFQGVDCLVGLDLRH